MRSLIGVSLLCAAGLVARADDQVTFQVDMTRYTNALGTQSATNVEVRGAFNGWGGGWKLVNNGANIYTNTYAVVGAPSDTFQYKYTFQYWTGGVNWEDNNPPNDPGQPADAGNNRVLALGAVPGAQTLPSTEFYAPSISTPLPDAPLAPVNPVFFQVDMSRVTNSAGGPAFSTVDVRGDFTGWNGGNNLVAAGGGIYTNTIDLVSKSPGQSTSWKYTYTAPNGVTWEEDMGSPGPATNRSFVVVGGPAVQTLPLEEFSNPRVSYPMEFITNSITFQVDMRVQGVAWLNAGGIIRVSGAFGNWGDGSLLTNNPNAAYPTNWIYSGTFPAVYQKYFPNFPAASEFINNKYKFRANGGWEEPTFNPLIGSNDRSYSGTNAGPTLVLPLVLYSDSSLCDILPQDTTVTFALHLPNGTVATDGHVFDNSVDTVHINGESLLGAWQPWNFLLPQLTITSNDIYTGTFVIPAGRPRNQKVKYGINGPDNEGPQFSDHVQWIRATNDTVVMSPVEFGTNYASTRIQPRFGDLKAGSISGGNVPITWLGCGCVTLQSASTLTGGTWTEVPDTDGQSSTNLPAIGQQFFRLYNRPNP